MRKQGGRREKVCREISPYFMGKPLVDPVCDHPVVGIRKGISHCSV